MIGVERVARDARQHPLLPLHGKSPGGRDNRLVHHSQPGKAEAITKAGADRVLIALVRCHPESMPDQESDEFDWKSIQPFIVPSPRSLWPEEVRDLTPWVLGNLGDLGRELG